MQIRLLQAQAVKVNGDRAGKLREARYGCYKSFLDDGFYLFNYCLKEHELIPKTFGGRSLFNFFFPSLQLSTVLCRIVIILEIQIYPTFTACCDCCCVITALQVRVASDSSCK